jgi:RNA polymerase sigma-70 factor (TIGR02943 family)
MLPMIDNLPSATCNSLLGSGTAVVQLRKELLRFAVLRLGNPEVAEDVVQETIMAILTGSDRFSHRAALKTWVYSILKNKIADVFRDRWNRSRVDLATEPGEETDFDALFKENVQWRPADRAAAWGNPELSLENRQFWKMFAICMNKLPKNASQAFTMRELLGMETDEICKELGISSSNCWVILHRARLSLRILFMQNWFEQDQVAYHRAKNRLSSIAESGAVFNGELRR